MGIATLDQGRRREVELGHLRARWTFVGEAAGCVNVGVRRIELPAGRWSTPAHEHGRDEEIFFVLSGRGLSWQDGEVAEIRPGDCIVYLPGAGAHTVRALEETVLLAFGERNEDESVGFPRLGMSYVGSRMVESLPGSVGETPMQFVREAELGPPPLPDSPGPRPPTIVNVDDVEAVTIERPRVARTRRNLGRAAGSLATGLQHVVVMPDKDSAPPHCHSLEEEIFVILDGDGVVVLGEEQIEVRPGHVISRPAGTGIAHVFRAGARGLTYLAYGMRNPADVCYYPRSGKLAFRGLGVIARLERLDYWDGED
ncbi:MAG: cupin domain-containing protein [Solirubrobacterales bacterium]|nr:cupin domain-containing protein [Solirubrobacterales bacterium]